MCARTHLVVDETALEPGHLDANGQSLLHFALEARYIALFGNHIKNHLITSLVTSFISVGLFIWDPCTQLHSIRIRVITKGVVMDFWCS